MLKLILFVVPLSLDTFAVSAALGIQGLPAKERLRVSLLMSGFEMVMPVVGLLLGRGLGAAIGAGADYVAAAALLVVGAWILLGAEEDEGKQVNALSNRRGLALIGLGISISLDELAMGFSIGLLGLSIYLAILMIGGQAFLVSQLGLRLGTRLGTAARELAERLAGVALLALGVLVVVERLAS